MHSKLSIAREIAYDAFVEVMERKKDPDEMIDLLCAQSKSTIRRLDRSFIKEILFGGLRWYSKIFWILQNASKRDLNQSTPQIRASLVLGTYQIFYMDRVPDRAAVNESVEYIRVKGQAGAVSFVNGILRNIARRSEYFPKPDKDKYPVDYLTLQYAHPRWIVERWFARFGFERMKEILARNNQPPPYSIRINTMRVNPEKILDFRTALLRDEKTHSEKQGLRSCLHLREAPDLISPDGHFALGEYTIQGEASQLIGNLVDPKPNEIIVDACAGKGGKTTHLFELSKGQAHIIAMDKDASQLALAEVAAKRLGHNGIQWIHQNFNEFKPDRPIDKVLLDAPCSGLGVLRRHPEGKWHKTFDIVLKMARIQREMLLHAINILNVGGEVIYSVCSFEPEETLHHLDWIKKEFGDKIEQMSPLPRLPDYYKRFVTRENALLIYSGNKDSMDGFGAFILKKKSP